MDVLADFIEGVITVAIILGVIAAVGAAGVWFKRHVIEGPPGDWLEAKLLAVFRRRR